MAGGTCNPKVVLTENKYFRIPSNGNFIRATLGLQKPHTSSQANNQEVAEEGISYNFTKSQALILLLSPGQVCLELYKLRDLRETSSQCSLFVQHKSYNITY